MADNIRKKRRKQRKISVGFRKVHAEMEPFKTIGEDGKPQWDVEAACKNSLFIKEFLRRWRYLRFATPAERYWRFRGLLYKLDERIQKGYLRKLDSENRLVDYVRIKDEFWIIENFNRVCDELRALIESGEGLRTHSRKLQRKYRLRLPAVKDMWDWIASDYKSMTEDERRLLKEERAAQGAREKLGTCIIDLPPNWGPF